MTDSKAELLSHIPNSGIVQLPGRKFPAVAMQGDTLFSMLQEYRALLSKFKRERDEEAYYEILMTAQNLQIQLEHYEITLEQNGIGLPYNGSVRENPIIDEYSKGEQERAPDG